MIAPNPAASAASHPPTDASARAPWSLRALRLVHLVFGCALLLVITASIVVDIVADAWIIIFYFFIFYLLGMAIAVVHLTTARLLLRHPRPGLITSLLVSLLYVLCLWLAQSIAGFSGSLRLQARIALLVPLAMVVWTLVVWVRTGGRR